jgi:sarcosine oxidase subunit beta
MSGKVMVCRCEDVTLDDLAHAAALGYTDIEEAKRYTGLGTGPCQGKECMVACALFLAGAAQRPPSEIAPFTTRPPVAAVSLGTLARAAEDAPPTNGERGR